MLGTTKIYGCLADPINHVKAPTIFTSIFKNKNIDAVMVPIHLNDNNLENVVSSLKAIKNFKGMTVTIPHKTNITKLCDYLEPDAKFTGAVNWIKFDNDRNLIGDNFDGQGFVNGFIKHNYSLKNKNVCLFGAGGAAVSIGASLVNEHIKSLKLINRNINKAIHLKNKIHSKSNLLKVEVFPESDYTLFDSDIIINATSLGLKQTDKLPFDVSNSSPNSVIADIIMQPEETELLKYAKSLGRSIHYGKYMIESQIDLVGSFLKLW